METKWCGAGQHEVSVEKFWKRGDKLQPNCISCQKSVNKERYNKNKKRHIKAVIANTKSRFNQFYDWKRTLQCRRCDENYSRALDFHHLDPSKKDVEIGNALNRLGWKRFIEELNKCVVLCKVCHVKVHDGILEVSEEDTIGSVAKFGIAPGSYPD